MQGRERSHRPRHRRDRRPRRRGHARASSKTAGASSCRGSPSASSSASRQHERLELVQADLFDPDAVARAVADAPGPRCARWSTSSAASRIHERVHETPIETFEEQLRLNLRPAYLACQRRAAARCSRPASGAIVCVSSRAARRPFPGAAGYIVAKAAVLALVDALDAEYRKDGVRVNAVLPSVIDTPANRASMPDADFDSGCAPSRSPRDPLPVLRRRVGHERRARPCLRSGVMPARHVEDHKWWTLIAVCVATFMLLLDITIVNVALPDIAKALHSSLHRPAVGDRRLRADARRAAAHLAARRPTASGGATSSSSALGIFTLASLAARLSTSPLDAQPRARACRASAAR